MVQLPILCKGMGLRQIIGHSTPEETHFSMGNQSGLHVRQWTFDQI